MLRVILDAATLAREVGDPRGHEPAPGALGDVIIPVFDISKYLSPPVVQSVQISGGGGVLTQDQSLLWQRGNSRASGAGGAGQFSGVGETYQSEIAGGTVQRFQIVGLRVVPSIAAILRLYYETVDIFTGPADLGNLVDGTLSTVAGEDWGGIEWLAQTATPDTTNIGNHSARATSVRVFGLRANEVFDWPLERGPLWDRLLTTQTQAMGWGVWGAAAVTAITVDYGVILRKLP